MRTVRDLPSYLTKNIENIEKTIKPKKKTTAKKQDPDRKLFAQATDLIDHGAGVYEDQAGYVWYREGDYLYKADTEEDRIVRDAIFK